MEDLGKRYKMGECEKDAPKARGMAIREVQHSNKSDREKVETWPSLLRP